MTTGAEFIATHVTGDTKARQLCMPVFRLMGSAAAAYCSEGAENEAPA